MASRNSAYWQKRFEQLEAGQNALGRAALPEIESIYRKARNEIEAEIFKWYGRLADNNEISMSAARKLLSADELEEFHWSVEDYIEYGRVNAFSGRYMKKLENASAKFHISRYEALKLHLEQSLEAMSAKLEGRMAKTLSEAYRSGYYHTAFELQKGFGIGWDIASVDQRYIEKVLSKPWASDGYNFSERIWKDKDQLISTLDTELTRGIIRGEDLQKTINRIAKALDVKKSKAGRLVMTEEAYFSSLAQEDMFREFGVEKYEIVATLDEKTSEICQEMDGRVFDMKDYEPGTTAPPFHPNCRTTTSPYFEDMAGIGERAARDQDGKTYYVPSDMKYSEWKEVFVEGGSKEGIIDYEEYETQHFVNGVETNTPARVTNPTYGYRDVTEEWLSRAGTDGHLGEDVTAFKQDGVLYKVDGHNVKLDYSEYEKHIAEVFAKATGQEIRMMPTVKGDFEGIDTPDLLAGKERIDIKTPKTPGPKVMFRAISHKRGQADNFIFDITECGMDKGEAVKQIDKIFSDKFTGFVRAIYLMMNDKLIGIYSRV